MTTRRTATRLLIVAAASIGALAAIFAIGGFRLNLTPSAPVGLWRIEPLNRSPEIGDRIFVCLPDGPAVRLALQRHYLPRGLCPSGGSPLIKSVAATGGQTVTIVDHVQIDGQRLLGSLVLSADAAGRVMPRYAGGIVGNNTVYLHSDFQGSYDSRYFGPVPTDGVLGLAIEVLTFSP
ncbi:conjugative transfer signal peptidase TraF [Devosia sp. Naph2]|uniref:conjugative transfer signal peptidase TraF n=1 Tax=Devosia polycyclovorans TaxID=3345148 RepID=UPI0035CF02BE